MSTTATAARLEHAQRHFCRWRLRVPHVVEHQRQHRDVESLVIDGQRLEIAAANIDVIGVLRRLRGRLDHGGGAIHGNHAGQVVRTRR